MVPRPFRANLSYPQAILNHTKEDWNEAMEMQAISPHLRLMLGEGFIVITSEGKVWVRSGGGGGGGGGGWRGSKGVHTESHSYARIPPPAPQLLK